MTDCGCGAWRLRIPKNLRDNKIGDVQFVCIWHCMSHVSQIYVFLSLSFFFLVFLITEGSAGKQKTLTYCLFRTRDSRSSWSVEWIEIGTSKILYCEPRAFVSLRALSSISSFSSWCRSIPYLRRSTPGLFVIGRYYCLIIMRSACNI